MASRTLPPLYLVTNRHQTNHRPLLEVLKDALQAGVQLIQLRERDLDTRRLLSLATEVLALTRAHGASLLINDRVDIVKAIDADGVHLRADSLPIQVARRILGPRALIGVSTHSVEAAEASEAEGADFGVFGPIYDTPSKRSFGPPIGLHALQEVHRRCHIPIFAIGGMTPNRAAEVRGTGTHGVAVMSSILEAASVFSATQHFLAALKNA